MSKAIYEFGQIRLKRSDQKCVKTHRDQNETNVAILHPVAIKSQMSMETRSMGRQRDLWGDGEVRCFGQGRSLGMNGIRHGCVEGKGRKVGEIVASRINVNPPEERWG